MQYSTILSQTVINYLSGLQCVTELIQRRVRGWFLCERSSPFVVRFALTRAETFVMRYPMKSSNYCVDNSSSKGDCGYMVMGPASEFNTRILKRCAKYDKCA